MTFGDMSVFVIGFLMRLKLVSASDSDAGDDIGDLTLVTIFGC